MRVVAIIQARMGSTRLPGKVLMPIAGKPVLWHVIHRLRKCKTVDSIALAISTNPVDDPLEKFGENVGINVIRGPEDNVLERYYIAAKALQADIIIRVTGDAPLIDPDWIDHLVLELIDQKIDWVGGDPEIPSIHEGFSPFTFKALEKLIHDAGNDPAAREHVTAYFKEHPEFVPIAYVNPGPEYRFSGARISVDTPADLRFLEEVYRLLKTKPGEADVRDVVALLQIRPDLMRINSFVHQKKPYEPTRHILICCDSDDKFLKKSLKFSLKLAEILRDFHGFGITFFILKESKVCELVGKAGFSIESFQLDNEEQVFGETVNRLKPEIIINYKKQVESEKINKLREKGIIIIDFNDINHKINQKSHLLGSESDEKEIVNKILAFFSKNKILFD